MLTINNLTLEVEGRTLFSNFSVSLLPGAIVHLQGVNGSGKTSLLRIIAGLQQLASSGEILFKGRSLQEQPKPYVNYIGHKLGIKDELTVYEHMFFWARLYRSEMLVEAASYYFQLDELLDKRCYQLSAGNKQKLAMSKLLLCPADLWLLDELDVSLDKDNKQLLYNTLMTKANNGGIVIFTSHSATLPSAINLHLEDFDV